MGKSPAACFRIITCAGGNDGAGEPQAKDAGDLNVYENKSSGDKRGWSFRKKSGRHRGLSNNAVSETPTVTRTRETLESALLKSPSPDNNNVSEKPFTVQPTGDKSQIPATYVVQPAEEKTQLPVPHALQPTEDKTELVAARLGEQIDDRTELPVPVESRGTETEDDVNETESRVNLKGTGAGDATVTEKDIGSEIGIASQVDTLESESNDVIIIRKENDEEVEDNVDESVIIIIQAATRGFLARRKLLKHKKAVKLQAAIRGHLVRRQAMGSLRCVQAIVKMQALVRARQSMQHISRVSAIPDKGNEMIKTNASSDSVEKLLQNKFARHLMESAPKTKPINIKCDPKKPSSAWNWLERWMFVSPPEKTSKPDLATEEQQSENFEAVASPKEVPSHNRLETTHSELESETEKNLSSDEASKIEVHHVELPEAEKVSDSDAIDASLEVDSQLNQSHPFGANEPGSLSEEHESVNEQPKNSLKRKASNPAFIAAQSKFEVLSSSTASNKSMALSYVDVLMGESNTDRTSLEADSAETPKELSTTENVARAQFGELERGTDLSVSSTLDTPVKSSEIEAAELNNDAEFSEKGTFQNDEAQVTNINVKDASSLGSVEDPQEKVGFKDEVENSVVSETQEKPVLSTPDAKKKYPETETGHQAYPFSPEASSPMTMPESQATPASQASSVKAKKDKTEKSSSSQKRKVSKKTTSSPNHDSGGPGSMEQEAGKDHKNGRRRNSFGFDQEPRDSSGGKSTVPRFMRPTESARAKVQEYNSPKSSPDVQERETSVKKRHSLPGANGKQSSSPRIQRSSSQAQPATKERKWQR